MADERHERAGGADREVVGNTDKRLLAVGELRGHDVVHELVEVGPACGPFVDSIEGLPRGGPFGSRLEITSRSKFSGSTHLPKSATTTSSLHLWRCLFIKLKIS